MMEKKSLNYSRIDDKSEILAREIGAETTQGFWNREI